jgi:hypothetical protein
MSDDLDRYNWLYAIIRKYTRGNKTQDIVNELIDAGLYQAAPSAPEDVREINTLIEKIRAEHRYGEEDEFSNGYELSDAEAAALIQAHVDAKLKNYLGGRCCATCGRTPTGDAADCTKPDEGDCIYPQFLDWKPRRESSFADITQTHGDNETAGRRIAWAYEQGCKALEKAYANARALTAKVERMREAGQLAHRALITGLDDEKREALDALEAILEPRAALADEEVEK